MKTIAKARTKGINNVSIITKKLIELRRMFGNDGKIIAQHFRVIKSEKKTTYPSHPATPEIYADGGKPCQNQHMNG